jgi:hypothetical protein
LVERGNADVQVELQSATRADVNYTNPSHTTFHRGVDLPPDRERSVQVVSWLVVNLVRDEASELLDELRARRREEADARAAAGQAAADIAAADKAAAEQAAATEKLRAAALADKAAAEARKRAEQDAKRRPARDDLLRDPLHSIDAAVSTPLSLLRDSPKRELHLQLALGYGESGAIQGAAISPGVLRVRRELLGLVVGAGAAFVGRSVQGAVVAMGYSQVDGNLEGVLVGGGAAVQRGAVARGAVLAVGGAMATDMRGVVLGGGFATATSLQGIGASAGATIIRGPSEGVLLSAGANSSTRHLGVEISGGVNVGRELNGVAIAPINVHRRVKGVQFGVVNVAEEVDGAAIGVINIVKNGRVQPVLWSGWDGSAHVAIKSLAGYVFTEFGSGIDLNDDQFSYDGGLGGHFKLGRYFFLEPSVHYSATHGFVDASGAPDGQYLSYLAQLGFRVGDKLDLLAGGGVRHTVAGGTGAVIEPEARVGIAFF